MERRTSRNLSSPLNASILVILFISQSCFHQGISNSSANDRGREVLEIGIGIGSSPPAYPPDYGDCPDCRQPPELPVPCPEPVPPAPPEPERPPPLSPPPPIPPPPKSPPPIPPPPKSPPSFPNYAELKMQVQVIQRLKSQITYDPKGITKTWTGKKLCIDKSKYKGFICDIFRDGRVRVAGIKFNGYRFDGNLTLKDFQGRFQGIIFFHINSNNFTGGVPSELNKIPNLYELDLSNNKLSGEFPKEVLAATQLTFLDLRFNKFTGPVPPQAFSLDLDALFLNNNEFYGEIPENLGSTPAIYLTLANNKFTGPIPKSIGQAGNTLLEVLLLGNQLSGCLPYEIGLLKKAEVFDASVNQLTGPIPHSFGCLSNMQILNFSYNHLYGAVPEELCKISSLEKLTLKYNYFTQIGPKCRKLIELKVLDISMNCILDVPSQRTGAECEAFFLKHHSCPDLPNLPCKIDQSASELTVDPAPKKHRKAPSHTYHALDKHHRH